MTTVDELLGNATVSVDDDTPVLELPTGHELRFTVSVTEWTHDHPTNGEIVATEAEVDHGEFPWWELFPERADAGATAHDQEFPNLSITPRVETPDDGEQASEAGLYDKYAVFEDGEPVEDCFVLEPVTDSAAREALIRYAEETDDEDLAADLRDWVTAICTEGDDD